MTMVTDWKPPPGKLELVPGEIHVWRIWLDAPQRAPASARTLSPDELQHARRFAFERDAHRFMRRRIALRRILADYTGAEPRELRFTCGAWGKPRLAQQYSEATIEFNLTHAEGLSLVAVCGDRPVGVDVESTRSMDGMMEIADKFFSQSERAALFNVPATQRTQAFFNGWTRKEALLKAMGGGLAFPLEQFEVSLAPMEPARVLSIRGDTAAAARWLLTARQPAPGYIAALAVESVRARLACWEYGMRESRTDPVETML